MLIKIKRAMYFTGLIGIMAMGIFGAIAQAHSERAYYNYIASRQPEIAKFEATEEVTGLLVPDNSYQMRVTAFSSVECKTSWCVEHAVEDRGQRVALNKKFGKWSKVYIQAYDKYYEVIGTTDYKTDVDIWFGSCRDCAIDFGSKKLLVHLIK